MIVQSIRDMRHDVKYTHEQRLKALGQLAAGVGHKILNPLTSIRLALRSTLESLRTNSGSKESPIEYLELVDGEIDRCIQSRWLQRYRRFNYTGNACSSFQLRT